MLRKILQNQGSIALILVIMITSLTLISAVALTLINVSEKMANYQLQENEDVLNQKQACLDDALARISSNNYATGTYALDLTNVHCYYQMSETVTGLKTVTTTASSLSSLGVWSQSLKAIINVSSTPISISSYQDLVGPTWDSSDWARRIRISVQPNKVAGDLYNFPVYVNLADLGTDFFNYVQLDAGDIVITTGDSSTKLLREVKSFGGLSPLSNEGVLYFLAPYLSSSVATDFYIYFGNLSANETNDAGVWVNYQMVQHLDDNPNTGSVPHERDSTDHANDLTSQGTIPNGDSVTAQMYRGIDLDNLDYFTIANRNDFTSLQGTISFWMKFNTVQDTTLFHFYETDTTDYIRSYYNQASNYLDLVIEDGDVVKVNVQYASPNTTGFHKVDWLQDGASVKLYFDGQAKTLTGTQSGSWWTDHLVLSWAKMGKGAWGVNNLIGVMDEFRVSEKALSANWLATEYNNQSSASTFYATSTTDVLGVYTPPASCAGYLSGGYCWYKGIDTTSCDSICSTHGGCVVADWNDDTSCTLCKYFTGFTACYNAGSFAGAPFYTDYAPFSEDCYYRAGGTSQTCWQTAFDGKDRRICACEE
jgi:hypothetical protein